MPDTHTTFQVRIMLLIFSKVSPVILLWLTFAVYSQSPVHPVQIDDIIFEHLGEDEGISNYSSSVFEDHVGFLWFGAGPEGLYKYDGYEYQHYEFILDDTMSLPHNIVADIRYEDHAGNLWVVSGGLFARYNRATDDFNRFSNAMDILGFDTWATTFFVTEDGQGNTWLGSMGYYQNPNSGGLIRVEAGSDTFTLLQHDPADSASLTHNYVSSLYTDTKGELWIGTQRGGVDRYVSGHGERPDHFVHYKYKMDDPVDTMRTAIFIISEDANGTLWAGSGYGVLRYDSIKDRFTRYRLDPDINKASNKISCFPQNPTGTLWVGTGNGVAVFDIEKDEFTLFEHDPSDPSTITPGKVTNIIHDNDGSTWILTDDGSGTRGINRYDPVSGKFHLFNYQEQDDNSLSSNEISDVMIDRNGSLWISAASGGINKYDPSKRKFKSLPNIEFETERRWPMGVLSLCLDRNERLWIGTNGKGLYSYDLLSGKTVQYPYDPDHPSQGSRSTMIWDVIEQPEGILWIGGDSGLSKLDTWNMEFEHYWIDPDWKDYFGPNYIRHIAARSPDKLWIATMGGGLFSFEPGTGSFQSHMNMDNKRDSVPASGLMSVMEDENGTVWVGSLGGLHRYTPKTEDRIAECHHYKHNPKDTGSIGSDMVGDMLMAPDGILWAATGGGGLNRIDPATGQLKRYTKKQGLISNSISAVTMDRQGKLWLGSFSGLAKFDPETETCTSYDRSDGLPSLEINPACAFQTAEGVIYFAGPNGIFRFHPDSIPYNAYVPPVVITQVTLYGEPLLISSGEVLELKHDENFISFEFAALNYSNSHKNQYRYCMTGLDPDTVFAGDRRAASYTDIKPGRYTFWVTGSNNDGIWNPRGTSMEIIIHRPWRQSELAIGLYILIFIFGVLGIIRWRTWKLLNDRKTLEQLVNERTSVIEEKDRHILEMDRMKTRFFANISHEFRTPLTLILSPLEELMSRREATDPEYKKLGVIRRNGKRMLNLVNQLLEISKLDSGKLKLELVREDVVRTLRLTCASFISMAEKNRISYSYHLPDREWILHFDAGKLETILNNLLSNAFKFTPKDGIIECYARIEEIYTPAGKQQGPIQLTISVIDSGPGIPQDQAKHIFDRFYQVVEQNHTEISGTGIGLSLTKELVELLHGEISVNSEPGEGSCFMVIIPLGKEHLKETEYNIVEKDPGSKVFGMETIQKVKEERDLPDQYEDHVKDSPPSNRLLHVLVVEDNDDLRSYLREQLQGAYTIVEANSGSDGLKKALRVVPDLILTDVMMPGMDGMELCRQLKTNERTSHIPVIMLTAKADFDSRISGLETGADDYILKPFQMKELHTRIQNLIRQRMILRERFSRNIDAIAEDFNLNSYDVKFIRRVTEVVENHLSDFEFDVKQLQAKSGLGPTQLYRKLHALTGYSPSRFIRHMRLKRAAKMLEEHQGSITHVAFEVGFGNLSYFTKCFREEYGISPSEYTRQHI
ncbi:MAG: two-component regulator propeller domain-containing protein [Bacteroidales bacterium]